MAEISPTQSDVHINRPLTDFAQGWIQDASNFVAGSAFPFVSSAKSSDTYFEFDREQSLRDEADIRPLGAEAATTSTKVSTKPFNLVTYALAEDVDDRVVRDADAPLQPEEDALEEVLQKMLIRREKQMADAVFSSSANVWFNGQDSAGTGDATQNWSNSSGNPLQAIDTAMEGIAKFGQPANSMLMGLQAFNTLIRHNDVLELISGGATTERPAVAMAELLASRFGVDGVYVSQAADDNGRIVGDDLLIYRRGEGRRAASAARLFSWVGHYGTANDGIRVTRKRKELADSWRVQAEMAQQVIVTGGALGHLFRGVAS